jgi:hypothetical protein
MSTGPQAQVFQAALWSKADQPAVFPQTGESFRVARRHRNDKVFQFDKS